jgi:uncharacterized protein (TIGR03437 family)
MGTRSYLAGVLLAIELSASLGAATLPTQTLTIVSGASFIGAPAGVGGFPSVAENSIITIFGPNIATTTAVASDASPNILPPTLAGVGATIEDASGSIQSIDIFAVSPGQINGVLPGSVAPGIATIYVLDSAQNIQTGQISIEPVEPAFFTADQTGRWLPVARVVTRHQDGTETVMDSIANCTSTPYWNGYAWTPCAPVPINVGNDTDVTVLELFGTGFRNSAYLADLVDGSTGPYQQDGVSLFFWNPTSDPNLEDASALPVQFSGSQGGGKIGSFYGMDQLNVVLPPTLAGTGLIVIGASAVTEISSAGGFGTRTTPRLFLYIQ